MTQAGLAAVDQITPGIVTMARKLADLLGRDEFAAALASLTELSEALDELQTPSQ